ncbi:MAG: AtpZ/AtpI family protein [Bacteroidetes bacterium]|nr:AtpZ/AtpI family protein [Bacteroidota bacterium]MDA0874417.1 AtpZ/AtpI family protein [Bacteroidota bacterium]
MAQDPGWQGGLKDAAPYLSIGIQLAGTMVVYVGLGWLVDRWLDTAPTFLIVGGVIGMVAFFIQLLRVSNELTAIQRKRPKDQTGKPKD